MQTRLKAGLCYAHALSSTFTTALQLKLKLKQDDFGQGFLHIGKAGGN